MNFDSKKFVEEEFNKSKYLTMNSSSPKLMRKRLTVLSPDIRTKLKKLSMIRSRRSNFFSDMDLEDFDDDDNFNNTLNKIIKKNVQYWVFYIEKYFSYKIVIFSKISQKTLKKKSIIKHYMN